MRIAAFILGASVLAAANPDQARELYRSTRYKEALAALGSDTSPAALLLAGQAHYQLEDFRKASENFEKLVAADPARSAHHHWLGRAYGRRAETASFISAPGLASKCRRSFEEAVRLDRRNGEALNDLFEYYLEAPGIMGGGRDKARALLDNIGKLDPAERDFAEAKIAEKDKNYPEAERFLQSAAAKAPASAGRQIDLALFYTRRGQYDQATAAFAKAELLEPAAPKLKFARAQALVESKRDFATARRLLDEYMKSALTVEDPSRKDAERLLARTR